jgi:DNA-binding protein YbaB
MTAMFKELSQLGSLLKQAPVIAGKMQEMRGRLAEMTFLGTAEEGLIGVVLSGEGRVIDCRIAPTLLDPQHQLRVQAGIVTATNAALSAMQQTTASEMQSATGGIDLQAFSSLLGNLPKP